MTDSELAIAARQGDGACLALLLRRHEPRLTAIALSVLRRREDARDAVHDAYLVAFEKIRQLRDPAAVGPWLGAVVRNVCRMRLRDAATERRALDAALREGSLAERVEDTGLGDRVWPALLALPEALRVTLLLRHFGARGAYEQIAALLGVPIGTVRSRLAAARARMAGALLGGADEPDPARAGEQSHWEATFRAFSEMRSPEDVRRTADLYAEDLLIYRPDAGILQGRGHWERELTDDVEHGVTPLVERVVAAGSLTLVELRFRNSHQFPRHCPPGASFVFWERERVVRRIHGYLDPYPSAAA